MLLSLLQSGCSVFGIRLWEQPPYQTQVQEDAFEAREYPPYLVAEVVLDEADFDEASSAGFKLLAGYIFGENQARNAPGDRESIEMTSPVQMEAVNESESLAMTAPVQMEAASTGKWRMAFVLPSKWTLETLPIPNDSRVKLREVAAERVAVVQFRGVMQGSELAEKEAELRAWIAQQGWEAVGPARTARYDPPFTLPFLRRNEVQLRLLSTTTNASTAQ
jgi:hypothetical protein